jgi:YHS domain-containing protein
MTLTAENAGRVSAVAYGSLALLAGLAFFIVTLVTGDYSWVSRIGGALWVTALTLVVLMPTVTPIVMARATGEKVQFATHDHEAMLAAEHGAAPAAEHQMATEGERSAEMAKDPVCGMDVDPASAAGSSEYKGKTYYFCAVSCKKSFDEDPEKYLS